MRGHIIAAVAAVALGFGLAPATAAEVVVGGVLFPLDAGVWSVAGDRLLCRAEDCDGAAVRVRRVEAPCDDALLGATVREDYGATPRGVRILPARDLELRVVVVRSPCRSLSANPVVACVAVGGATRLLTGEAVGGRRCSVATGATARVLDLLGRAGRP